MVQAEFLVRAWERADAIVRAPKQAGVRRPVSPGAPRQTCCSSVSRSWLPLARSLSGRTRPVGRAPGILGVRPTPEVSCRRSLPLSPAGPRLPMGLNSRRTPWSASPCSGWGCSPSLRSGMMREWAGSVLRVSYLPCVCLLHFLLVSHSIGEIHNRPWRKKFGRFMEKLYGEKIIYHVMSKTSLKF